MSGSGLICELLVSAPRPATIRALNHEDLERHALDLAFPDEPRRYDRAGGVRHVGKWNGDPSAIPVHFQDHACGIKSAIVLSIPGYLVYLNYLPLQQIINGSALAGGIVLPGMVNK